MKTLTEEKPARRVKPQEVAIPEATAEPKPPWRDFKPGLWQRDVNVRWFIQQNYAPYEGDGTFLAGPTLRTTRLWKRLEEMFVEERKKGVLDISHVPTSITAHSPGYIDRETKSSSACRPTRL
jgi:formate C-acetyltransferase